MICTTQQTKQKDNPTSSYISKQTRTWLLSVFIQVSIFFQNFAITYLSFFNFKIKLTILLPIIPTLTKLY